MKKSRIAKKLLQEDIAIRDMISSYEEISAMRMRRVKHNVLREREFLSGLNTAFGYVTYAYNKFTHSTLTKRKSILNTNGKTALVLLSANAGLYGDVIRQTFELFARDAASSTADIYISGILGAKLFREKFANKRFTFLESTDVPNQANIKAFVSAVSSYSNIVVYHGAFKTLLNQIPTRTFVTGKVFELAGSASQTDTPKEFIFEPDVESVAEYFEKQILALLLEQAIGESNLSKSASRMLSLDNSSQSLDKSVAALTLDYKKKQKKEMSIPVHIYHTRQSGGLLS